MRLIRIRFGSLFDMQTLAAYRWMIGGCTTARLRMGGANMVILAVRRGREAGAGAAASSVEGL